MTGHHEVKSWPEHFEAVWSGSKKAEVRFDDRGYRTGDILVLNEFNPQGQILTGRWLRTQITHRTEFEQKPGFVVLSIEVLSRPRL